MEKLITIIIPFYNSELFFEECLSSLINQTNKNFHVILVNDGSTDTSPIIAKKFLKNYPDLFSLLEQSNKGQGAARNLAFKNVSTPYVTFLDSDDYYGPRTIENLISYLKEDTEVLFFNPTIFDMSSKEYLKWYDSEFVNELFNKNRRLSTASTPELLATELSLNRCIWKTSFLRENNFYYPENIKWEDIPPHYFVLHNAKVCDFCPCDALYFYRINSGIQSTSKINKTAFDIPKVFELVIKKAKEEKWSKNEKIFIFRFLNMYARWSISETFEEEKRLLIASFHKLYKHFSYSLIFKLRKISPALKISKKDTLIALVIKNTLLSSLYKNQNFICFSKKLLCKLRFISQ